MLYTYGPSPALYAEADPDPSDPTAVPPRLVGVSIPVRNAATGADLPAATTDPGGYITYSIADVPAIQIQTKTWNSGTSSYDEAWITEYSNEAKDGWDSAAAVAQQASIDASAAQATAQQALALGQSSGAKSVAGVKPDSTGNVPLTAAAINAFAKTDSVPASQVSGLAEVATSGSYNNLSDRPDVGIPTTQKGQPYGVATLGADGKLAEAQRAGGGGSATVVFSDSAPANPSEGDLWADTSTETAPGGPSFLGQVVQSAIIAAGPSWAVPIGATVPADSTILLAVNCAGTSEITDYAATDSRGNTYTLEVKAAPIATHSTWGQPALFSCKVTNALTDADTITVTVTGGNGSGITALGGAWTGLGSSVATGNVQGNWTNSVDAGITGTAVAREVVFAAFYYSTGTVPDTYTPNTGFTALTGTSYNTTLGGMVAQRQQLDSGDSRAAGGSFINNHNCAGVGVVMATS